MGQHILIDKQMSFIFYMINSTFHQYSYLPGEVTIRTSITLESPFYFTQGELGTQTGNGQHIWPRHLITNLEIVYIFIAITVLADKKKMLPLQLQLHLDPEM